MRFKFNKSKSKRPPALQVVFYSARCDKLEANDDTPLILNEIQLPSKMLLRSKSYVTNLYIKRDLPIREIARQMNVSHSTVIECLRRLGNITMRRNL